MIHKIAISSITAGIAGVLISASTSVVSAQEYPVDTVTLVTHSSPGGGSDVYLREMAKYLGPALGVNVAVENVSGGSGAKAIAFVAQAAPDGSVFYGATPTYINMSLLSNPDYGAEDVEPVVNFFLDPQVLFVHKDSPYQSLADVVEAAKANPGTQKWGAGTPAALERIALEKFKRIADIEITIVTHDGGGDMMINVLNRSLDLGIGEIQEFRGQIDSGDLKVIATFTRDRLAEFPDVLTVQESGFDMVVNKFRGLVGPKGQSDEVIAAWEAAIPQVLENPDFKKWYSDNAMVPAFMPHAEFEPFVAEAIAEQDAFFVEYGMK